MYRSIFCGREKTSLIHVFILLGLFIIFHFTLLKFEKLEVDTNNDAQILFSKAQVESQKSGNYVDPSEAGQTKDLIQQKYDMMKPIRRKDGKKNKERFKGEHNDKSENSQDRAEFRKKNAFLEDHVIDLQNGWNEEKMKKQENIFLQRANKLSEVCEELEDKEILQPNVSRVYSNIRWVSDYKLIWCPVYKAASTTWMKNLLLLAGIKVANKSYHMKVRELYSPPQDPEERDRLLDTSMKMLIVRHPLERLLSAYRDKMLREDLFQKLQVSIRKSFPDPNASNDEKHPTFLQFLMHIKRDMKRFWKTGGQSRLNNHWQPVWWACGPCHVKYEVIAHVESLSLDQEYIIRKAGIQDVVFNAHTHASNFDSYNGTSQATQAYFSQIPKKLLEEVSDLYRPDFDLFGYSPSQYIKLGRP